MTTDIKRLCSASYQKKVKEGLLLDYILTAPKQLYYAKNSLQKYKLVLQ